MRTISWPFGAYIPTRVLRPTRLKASSILLRYPKSFPGATIFLMAFAGVARIFSFLDEEPETDDGYVMLINAQETNGVLSEASEHTRLWAWKHLHHDGTLTYTKLEERIIFDHVEFGYS